MARKNKMFADVAETDVKVPTSDDQSNDAVPADDSLSESSAAQKAPNSIIESADEIAKYIEEVEELRKYKEMFFNLQKEYDMLLEKLSELTFRNAQLEEEKKLDDSCNNANLDNKTVNVQHTKAEQNRRKVNYINKAINYHNNGYKDWN